jgi:hypothetical protein
VWCGEGGFLSSFGNANEAGTYPYWLDTTTLKPKKNTTQDCDNSAIFANIMAWAIYQAEFHGINSGGINPTTRVVKR